ncbi:hypothetical protein LCGC14_2055680 [marine sediment metagenome]|uniref:Uncharacterized protein n=1 Tax=marine sediment metagenome TaxID=412755 RepID=A0A0F9H164_9ZZZZ
MPEQIPQEILDSITAVLSDINSHRIEDLYASEQREFVEPEQEPSGNGGAPQLLHQSQPTGVRRFSLYVRYVVVEEEKALKEQQGEEV